jgi:hypothetical protein
MGRIGQHEAKKSGEMMIGEVVWRVGLPLENRTLPVKLKRASTSTFSLLLYANNAAACLCQQWCLANRHAQMPRHLSKTLEPVIIHPGNKSHQHGSTNCLSPNTKPLATLGTRKKTQDANSHGLPGHGRGGGLF